MMTIRETLADIHALQRQMLEFEERYGVRSDVFYAAYRSGEEPADDAWVLDFSEWAGVYEAWLERQPSIARRSTSSVVVASASPVLCMRHEFRAVCFD